ncbi:hypothetical protein TNCV_3840171 [Trichonephila clavipes]|nr:hypothetical protein TNCV_3840171 [Trichonephila clavipes]
MLSPNGTDGAIDKSAALYETAVPRTVPLAGSQADHNQRTVMISTSLSSELGFKGPLSLERPSESIGHRIHAF